MAIKIRLCFIEAQVIKKDKLSRTFFYSSKDSCLTVRKRHTTTYFEASPGGGVCIFYIKGHIAFMDFFFYYYMLPCLTRATESA